jgi:glycosyltransferase involved in cell wall biosynthesis
MNDSTRYSSSNAMTKRILLTTTDPGVGGVYQHNHILVSVLVQKYAVSILQPEHIHKHLTTEKTRAEESLGVKHYWLDASSQDLLKTLREINPDLIICSNSDPFSNFLIKRLAIQENIPFIVIEGLVEPLSNSEVFPYLSELYQHYQQARAVITVSHHNLNLLHQSFNLPPDKGQVIYYGRNPDYFALPDRQQRENLRLQLNIPTDAIVCFTSARIERRKGYQYQVEAIKKLKDTSAWPKLYFVWAGSGIFDPQLEHHIRQEIERLKLETQVKLLGQLPSVLDWLDIADIFILPSEAEGMPLAVMEAMAKGLAVIATEVSGIPEELGDTGKLLPDPNLNPDLTVQALVETLQEWVDSPSQIQTIGSVCRSRALELFQEERMIQETLKVVQRAFLPSGDYASPGLQVVQPDRHFPNMVVGDLNNSGWPYLRRSIPHNWYVDQRQPTIGFLNRDEALIVYNTALQFQGKKALEVGCWLGWSACHLALAGLDLDVIDPLLEQPGIYTSVTDSLRSAGVLDRVNLISGYSPQAVQILADGQQRTWSLIFIDGDHDAPAPRQDAILCAQYAEPDALIIFHDLNSPDVAEGLDYLRDQGWQTMIYQTMQIMGVAWRGNVKPIEHIPDPNVSWILPPHLKGYTVSGVDSTTDNFQSLDNKKPVVLIDGVFFQLFKTGIATVWKSLLKVWSTENFAQNIVVLDRMGTVPKIANLRYRIVPPFNVNDLDNDRALLQAICDEEKADLFMSTYFTTPISTPSVLMLYDMIPELMQQNMNHPFWRGKHYAIDYSSAYLCISENTARDLLRFFPQVAEDKVTVAYCGVSDRFAPASSAEVQTFKTKYGISKPYFLLVGPGSGYKNSILFFAAFSQLCTRQGFELVCTGLQGTLPNEFRNYTAGTIVHSLQLEDQELRLAYGGAVALVYPSKYEGFGLPVVEAMACGCPVITTRNASLPEVAGEAALYVDDSQAIELAEALCEIQKPAVRQHLIAKGLTQAKQFSWQSMADTVRSVLIQTSLAALNLKANHWIVFPDWSQGEEDLAIELQGIIKVIISLPNPDSIGLLIESGPLSEEEGNLFLANLAMNLLMEEEIEVNEESAITLTGQLSSLQWQELLPRLKGRVSFNLENEEAIAKIGADFLEVWSIEKIQEAF